MIDKNYWHNFSVTKHLSHLELKQVQYALTVETEGLVREGRSPQGASGAVPGKVTFQVLTGEQQLDQDDLNRIPEIIRCLVSASKILCTQ